MDELLFPLAAVATTFFLLIPLLTLVSRAALSFTRTRTSSWASFGSEVTFAWLVAPTILPVLWLTSSALHQSEPMRTAESCFIDHVEATTCIDTLMLLGLMIVGIAASVGIRLWRERPQVVLHQLGSDHELVRRLDHVIRDDAHLSALRVVVVRESAEPIYTLGLLRPIVVVDACFIRDADSQMLRAALLHEHAHIAGFDTLRSFIVRLCLGANPAGSLLAADFERWRNAREAVCDGEAVHRGGEPLALAEGILKAARFRCGGLVPGAALCGHNGAALKLRLALLLQGPPAPVRTIGHVVLAAGVFAALTVPHIDGLGLLEHFHFEVERLLHSLL
jgi:beta-lactamase regulating signal transducer with metallopeptidase domain